MDFASGRPCSRILAFHSSMFKVIPAPAVAGHGDWASAVRRARALVKTLTLEEKVNATTGEGKAAWKYRVIDVPNCNPGLFGRCVGNTGVSINSPIQLRLTHVPVNSTYR